MGYTLGEWIGLFSGAFILTIPIIMIIYEEVFDDS